MRYGIIIINITLLGCTVGPDYEKPIIETPCEWQSPVPEEMQSDSPDCFIWWQSLNDPILNSLIERMSSQNLELKIAAARLMQARIEANYSSTDFYPHIDASANYGHVQYNQKTLNRVLGNSCHNKHPDSHKNINFFEAGFDAEWELDLFGMRKHEINVLEARAVSFEQEYRHVSITLAAEVAKNYIQLRGLQEGLKIISKNIDSQQDTLQLTTELMETGFSSTIDQKQSQEQLSALLAQKPQIELAIHTTIHRLSILLGYSPGDLFCELNEPGMIPDVPCQKPIGIPSELLRRRPDILKAESDLVAATESIGSAVAALFPRLSLRGFIGDVGAASTNGFTWYAGPQILLPLLNSKLLEQDVKINKIKAQEALYAYQKTVLEAFEETENAISSYHYELIRTNQLAQALQASREAYKLVLELYTTGFKDYLEVLVANRSLLAAEDAYLQSRIELLYHYIALYKALGGPWECDGCL